jgi:hypothetical protein
VFCTIAAIPHWPLPAVRDLTRAGRWSMYDVSVLKMSNVSFRGKCARLGNNLKITSPTKLAQPDHYPLASQAGRLAGPVFYVYVFFWPTTSLGRVCVGRIKPLRKKAVCFRILMV